MSASKQDFPSELLYTPEGQAFELKDLMWYPYPSNARDTVEIVSPMTDVSMCCVELADDDYLTKSR